MKHYKGDIFLTCALLWAVIALVPASVFAVYTEGYDSVIIGSWFSFVTRTESDSVNGNFRCDLQIENYFGLQAAGGSIELNQKGQWEQGHSFDSLLVLSDTLSRATWGNGLIYLPASPNTLNNMANKNISVETDSCNFIWQAPLIVGVKENKYYKLQLTCCRENAVFFRWGYQDDGTGNFSNTSTRVNYQHEKINKKGRFTNSLYGIMLDDYCSNEIPLYDLRGRKLMGLSNAMLTFLKLPNGIYLFQSREAYGTYMVRLINIK